MDFKGFLADQFGLLTVYDLPLLLFAMLAAALLSWLAGWLCGAACDARGMAMLAGGVAVAVFLVKGSLPLAVALVAVLLLAGRRQAPQAPAAEAGRIVALVIGFGCGTAAVLPMALAWLPLTALLRWQVKRAEG
jgi:hypothetical protein